MCLHPEEIPPIPDESFGLGIPADVCFTAYSLTKRAESTVCFVGIKSQLVAL
jgi:hypothetical protein